jgi:cytochrome c biogenesis protein CcmG/thiol:disulfide interchange protein DsbE
VTDGRSDDRASASEPGVDGSGAQPQGRGRPALWISVGIGLVLAVLVAVLFTRPPAEQRLVKSPLVGHVAPDTFGIDQQRGRFVLVNFFATWCVPCQQEHDDLLRFAAAHPDDARVVSVAFDPNDDVRSYFERHGGNWPVVQDDDGGIATAWGVSRVPESYLVSPSGRVLGKITGGVKFDSLQDLLAKYERA